MPTKRPRKHVLAASKLYKKARFRLIPECNSIAMSPEMIRNGVLNYLTAIFRSILTKMLCIFGVLYIFFLI